VKTIQAIARSGARALNAVHAAATISAECVAAFAANPLAAAAPASSDRVATLEKIHETVYP
jgi:hypothetical protein